MRVVDSIVHCMAIVFSTFVLPSSVFLNYKRFFVVAFSDCVGCSSGGGSGSDGSKLCCKFTNEFFKTIWNELKHIPESFLLGIIICIPKGNKARNNLKNWRPFTLLNSLYKFYSEIWAIRIKFHLPKLIGESQKGFVQERFIGENTVLTLDILNET